MNAVTGRNITLTQVAGRLRAQGQDEAEILAALLADPARDGLAEAEVRSIAKSIGAKSAGVPRRNGNGNAAALPTDPVARLAAVRGWRPEALIALGAVGKDGEVRFPMRGADGSVCGWRRRRADGSLFAGASKKALTVKGGRNGFMAPWSFPADGVVLATEGEADAAAAISAGWPAVIATPGASPGRKVEEALQQVLSGRAVILAPDPDAAGDAWRERVGAALAHARCQVRFIAPGEGDLDRRLRASSDPAGELQRLVESALPWEPTQAPGADVLDENGRVVPLKVAKTIAAKRRLVCLDDVFLEYEGGVYRRREEWSLARAAMDLVGERVNRRTLDDALKVLAVLTAIPRESVHTVGRVINLVNGLLDLDKGMKPHDPAFVSTVQIPIAFDEAAACPTWERCLSDWFGEATEVVGLLQEFSGYCLIPDASQHKALVLIGDGANGKSVFADVLKRLVGRENVSAVALSALDKPFMVAELSGKLLNVTVEAEIREAIDEGCFKQIVAGDLIQGERKYRDPFVFRPFARWIVATNNLWRVDDRTDGFFRRLLIVRFGRQFAEGEQDRTLSAKLEAELPGILNWALRGLARLEARGRFEIPDSVAGEVASYRLNNNPVALWAEERLEFSPDWWTPSSELYSDYRTWCGRNGHRPLSSNRFSQEIGRLSGVSSKQAPDRYTRTRGFAGIRLGL